MKLNNKRLCLCTTRLNFIVISIFSRSRRDEWIMSSYRYDWDNMLLLLLRLCDVEWLGQRDGVESDRPLNYSERRLLTICSCMKIWNRFITHTKVDNGRRRFYSRIEIRTFIVVTPLFREVVSSSAKRQIYFYIATVAHWMYCSSADECSGSHWYEHMSELKAHNEQLLVVLTRFNLFSRTHAHRTLNARVVRKCRCNFMIAHSIIRRLAVSDTGQAKKETIL